MLGLDGEACTGCGLCQPACPQGAIALFAPLPVDADLALVACDRSGPLSSAKVACIHGVDLATLATLHATGVRRLDVRTGDCASCTYGSAPAFETRLETFNAMMASRGLSPFIRIGDREKASHVWSDGRDEEPENPGRRRLLMRVSGAGDPPPQPARLAALSALLMRPGAPVPDAACHRAVPHIDPARCTGCDMCMRACPDNALGLGASGGGYSCYRIEPGACTGCGICVSLCEAEAISLSMGGTGSVQELVLASATCQSCGATYHRPGMLPDNGGRCPTCAHTRHHAKLFQVMR